MLETRFARVPGDMGNATTWPFPVLYRVVRGASARACVLDGAKGLLPAFIAAARELVDEGAEAITTTCGFLSLFQRELAAAVAVPVATSALMQIPWVQATLPPGQRRRRHHGQRAVADPAHFAAVGAPADTPVAGVEGGRELFRVLVKAEKHDLDTALAEADILAAGATSWPAIRRSAPSCSNARTCRPMRAPCSRELGLPVFDVYSLITWLHQGLRPRRFG